MSNGHGGKRKGAGRPKGAATRMNEKARAQALAGGESPLDYLLRVMRDESQEPKRRDEAAKAAIPYTNAKLSSVEMTGKDGEDLMPSTVVVLPSKESGD